MYAICLYKKLKIRILFSVSVCSISCTLFRFRGQQTLKWFFRLQFKHDFPYAGHFPLGWEPLQNLHFLIISFDFLLEPWWRGLRSLHVNNNEVFILSSLYSFLVAVKWNRNCLSQSFQVCDTLPSNKKCWEVLIYPLLINVNSTLPMPA